MLIAGVLAVVAAFLSATFGLWTLARPGADDPASLARRAVAPAQLAAAVMLAAAGVVALAGPPGAPLVLVLCTVGALGTLAAGSWQGARYLARRQAAVSTSGCGGGCTCAPSGR